MNNFGIITDKLKIGDIVTVKPIENEADANAVGAYLDGEFIGFVPNSENTIPKGTMSASELKNKLMDPRCASISGLIVGKTNFVNSLSKKQTVYVGKLFIVPNRKVKSAADSDSYMEYIAGGVAFIYPEKAKLLKQIQNEPVDVEIRKVIEPASDTVVYKIYMIGADHPCGEIQQASCDSKFYALFAGGGETVFAKAVAPGKDQAILEQNRGYLVRINEGQVSENPLYNEIDAAIARCVGQTGTLEEKMTFMVENKISNKLIRRVFNQMDALGKAQKQVPRPKFPYMQKKGQNLSDVLAYMTQGKLVRLVGEKGSGKNTLVETACWLMNRPMLRVQGSVELDKMDILGSRTLNNGNTDFEISPLLETLRNNGVVVVDEANTVRPEVLTLLHSLTDNARSIDVPGYGTVQMGDKACIVYTLNENYVGTGEMNAATIDRGPTIIVKQEEDIENLLSKAVPNADQDDIKLCGKIYNNIRKSIRESGTLSMEAITIRGFIDALQCSEWIPLNRSLVQNVSNKAQSEEERTIIEGIITSFV